MLHRHLLHAVRGLHVPQPQFNIPSLAVDGRQLVSLVALRIKQGGRQHQFRGAFTRLMGYGHSAKRTSPLA